MKAHILYSTTTSTEYLVLGGAEQANKKRQELLESTDEVWYWRAVVIDARRGE